MRHWIRDEDEPDCYERQLRDEKEGERQRTEAWVDNLNADELKELEQAPDAAGTALSTRHATAPTPSG